MKNSSDTIGNRTRDHSTCSAVPQPTALPRAPCIHTCTVVLVRPYEYKHQVCEHYVNVLKWYKLSSHARWYVFKEKGSVTFVCADRRREKRLKYVVKIEYCFV